jgi:hypothetical protein
LFFFYSNANIKDINEDIYQFKTPESEQEFRVLENKTYSKDGNLISPKALASLAKSMSNLGIELNKSHQSQNLERTPSQEMLSAKLVPREKIEKPAMIIQVSENTNK